MSFITTSYPYGSLLTSQKMTYMMDNDEFNRTQGTRLIYQHPYDISLSDVSSTTTHCSFLTPTGVSTLTMFAWMGVTGGSSDGFVELEAGGATSTNTWVDVYSGWIQLSVEFGWDGEFCGHNYTGGMIGSNSYNAKISCYLDYSSGTFDLQNIQFYIPNSWG